MFAVKVTLPFLVPLKLLELLPSFFLSLALLIATFFVRIAVKVYL